MDAPVSDRWQWMGAVFSTAPGKIDGARMRKISLSKANANLTWGRDTQNSIRSSLGCMCMVTAPPFLIAMTWIALEHFDSSLSAAFVELYQIGSARFANLYAPALSLQAIVIYAIWTLFQGLLYAFLPGKGTGQLTPAGHLLDYPVNGFLAWQITTVLAVAGYCTGVFDPAIVTDNWDGLLMTMNVWGYMLSCISYLKAYWAPDHPNDRKFSGSFWYDFYMGIELNPRFGKTLDWKLFHNGRPGIIGWTLIDLAYTVLQYRTFGHVTNSIVIVNILHTAYVIDFFVNEDWYLRTIDICHDHFGFYLAWGSAAWLPTMYTLQVQYLARHPVQLHPLSAALITAAGLGGYVLFRAVNDQKNRVRKADGACTIWRRPAVYIRAAYRTSDGAPRESLLLCSGWWGLARHANYAGDLLLSYAMCATCGPAHLLPWIYALFMTAILVHRCHRDEKRCAAKYGPTWAEYCERVPYRLIPGVY